MEAVAGTADRTARLKRRAQLTRRRIAGGGVEVGDAVEQAASADERVDLLPLCICRRAAARTGGAQRRQNGRADDADPARAQAPHPFLEPIDDLRGTGAVGHVVDSLEPDDGREPRNREHVTIETRERRRAACEWLGG